MTQKEKSSFEFKNNRFQIKTFLCNQKKSIKYASGTVHYEHPFVDQVSGIDENGCIQLQYLDIQVEKADKDNMTQLEENFYFNDKQKSVSFNLSKKSNYAQNLGGKTEVKQMIVDYDEKEIILNCGKRKKIVKNKRVNVEQKSKKVKDKVVKA